MPGGAQYEQREGMAKEAPHLALALPNAANFPVHNLTTLDDEEVMRDATQSVSIHGTHQKGIYLPHSGQSSTVALSNGGKIRFDFKASDIVAMEEMLLEFDVVNNGTGNGVLMPTPYMIERVEVRLDSKNAHYVYSLDEFWYMNCAWDEDLFKQRADSMNMDKYWKPNTILAAGERKKMIFYMSSAFFAQAGMQGAGTLYSIQLDFQFRSNAIAELRDGATYANFVVENSEVHVEDFYLDTARIEALKLRHGPDQRKYIQQYYASDEHKQTRQLNSPATTVSFNIPSISGNVAALFFMLRLSEEGRNLTQTLPINRFQLRGPSGDPLTSREFVEAKYNRQVQSARAFPGKWLEYNDVYYIPFASDLAAAVRNGTNTGGFFFKAAGDIKLEIEMLAAVTRPVWTIVNTTAATAGSIQICLRDPLSKRFIVSNQFSFSSTVAQIQTAIETAVGYRDALGTVTVTGTFNVSGNITITLTGSVYGNQCADKFTQEDLLVHPTVNSGSSAVVNAFTAGVPGHVNGTYVLDVIAIRGREAHFKNGMFLANQQ